MSYHNRWFSRREFEELLDIAAEIKNEGISLQGVIVKLKAGESYSVYTTNPDSGTNNNYARREVKASLADLEIMEAEADMYIAHGEMQEDLLLNAFCTAIDAELEIL